MIDSVIEIHVDDDEIVRRMSGRRVHPESGRTYHLVFNPPKSEGKDDVSGEALVQRDDDKEETVRNRLQVYHRQTEPLIHYYSAHAAGSGPRFLRVDGIGTVEDVRDRIIRSLQ